MMRSGSRRSSAINKDNVKGLKLAYAVALGGTSANENLQATPLAEDGFLYIVDQWGVLYKIDARSGETGRIVWRMDPGQGEGAAREPRRRAVGQSRRHHRELSGARHRHQQGDRPGRLGGQSRRRPAGSAAHRGAACGQGQDRDRRRRRRPRRARLHRRARRRDRQGRLEKYVIPAPGEPGSGTWKDKNNAWQTGGGAMWVTGSYDVATTR